jgi:hypothetical protein
MVVFLNADPGLFGVARLSNTHYSGCCTGEERTLKQIQWERAQRRGLTKAATVHRSSGSRGLPGGEALLVGQHPVFSHQGPPAQVVVPGQTSQQGPGVGTQNTLISAASTISPCHIQTQLNSKQLQMVTF